MQFFHRKTADKEVAAAWGLGFHRNYPVKSVVGKYSHALNYQRIFIYGKVERQEFIDFLNKKECVVCIPSRSESFSLVAIEAMATSHPLVVSNIPVFNEITNADVSVMFKIDDINSLKLSIEHAFVNYETLSLNGREMFLRKFTVNKMTLDYKKLYREILC